MSRGVEAALGREIDQIVQAIPNEDLAIQWDVCWEVFACDKNDWACTCVTATYNGPFGAATECVWGRRKAETLPALLKVHREVAAAI